MKHVLLVLIALLLFTACATQSDRFHSQVCCNVYVSYIVAPAGANIGSGLWGSSYITNVPCIFKSEKDVLNLMDKIKMAADMPEDSQVALLFYSYVYPFYDPWK